MDATKIKHLLAKRCGRAFLGVFPIDMLPKTLPSHRPLLLDCNNKPHDNRGEHWILFIDSTGEYFNSFAQPPLSTFRHYLENFCNSYVTNTKVIQSTVSYSCGHFCVFYCLMKMLDYSMKDIEAAFSNDNSLNDLIVHRFVCHNL